MALNYCGFCGTPVTEEAKFCSECGTQLSQYEVKIPSKSESDDAVEPRPAEAAASLKDSTFPLTRSRRRTVLLTGGLLLVALVLVAAISIALFGDSDRSISSVFEIEVGKSDTDWARPPMVRRPKLPDFKSLHDDDWTKRIHDMIDGRLLVRHGQQKACLEAEGKWRSTETWSLKAGRIHKETQATCQQ